MTSANRINVLTEVLEYAKLHERANFSGVELTNWEETFIGSMSEKLDRYGEHGITISDKQYASLERLLKKFEDAE